MPSLILASTSPRRKLLLAERGFAFVAVSPGIDDSEFRIPENASPHAWTTALAYLKASAAARTALVPTTAIILGADTIVVKHGRILGQPKTASEARETLNLLENGSHEVITGVAILSPIIPGGRRIFAESARVTVGALGAERIDPYVESGAWKGKAGAYNLLERLSENWPMSYQGDPTCIMGLPMERLTPVLHLLLSTSAEPASS